ncbi:MAG: YfcE family phosphodiesterase [Epulopiscium sp. Nele67-Bin004]|nr:MAG: YfcE family phosphodiesterase [Epulopiscium sp. Nele67-Bin004]
MKYLIISDIHGSLSCTNDALTAFNEHQCDYIIVLGDILYHGPRNPLPIDHDPKGVADALNEYASKIICVGGNCEAPVDQMMLNFPCLSEYSLIVDDGVRIFATHGHIYNPENLPKLDGIDIFLYGHTHLYEIENHNDTIICNPGSITLPKQERPRTYAVYENRTLTIYDFEHHPLRSLHKEA